MMRYVIGLWAFLAVSLPTSDPIGLALCFGVTTGLCVSASADWIIRG